MCVMNLTKGIGIALGVAALGACAEGIEPPTATTMVEVRDGLTFDFGIEGLCKGSDEPTCDTPGQIPLDYPKVNVTLKPFAIDQDEVTNFQYEYCVAKGVCTEPQFGNAPDQTQFEYYGTARFHDFPVVNVTWDQADAYCKFVGKRLPSEMEWERVAKGAGAAREYPVEGDFASADGCEGKLNAVGCGGDQKMERTGNSSNDFVIEGGKKIYHLAANASEWTDTWWDLDVSCQGDAPCTLEADCAGNAACIGQAKSCDACATLSSGECHYMCEGFSRKTILCTAFSGTGLDPATVLPGSGSDKAVRGGSVSTTRNQRCFLKSWYREQRSAKTFLGNSLGFRCAKGL